nr:MAG: plasmid replication protein [Bacteriophage sp.]
MKKANNIVRIPTSLNSKFFRYWFEFLQPFHNLTNREIDVIAAFVKQRYQLSKVIKDDNILDKVIMSEDTKKKVREECNITLPHFQVIMGKLRKNKVIVDGKINPRFIPNIDEETGYFQLLLLFELK